MLGCGIWVDGTMSLPQTAERYRRIPTVAIGMLPPA